MDPVVIERLIEQGRDGYEARLAAGQARLKAGELTSAIEHLRRGYRIRPGSDHGLAGAGSGIA